MHLCMPLACTNPAELSTPTLTPPELPGLRKPRAQLRPADQRFPVLHHQEEQCRSDADWQQHSLEQLRQHTILVPLHHRQQELQPEISGALGISHSMQAGPWHKSDPTLASEALLTSAKYVPDHSSSCRLTSAVRNTFMKATSAKSSAAPISGNAVSWGMKGEGASAHQRHTLLVHTYS